MSGGASAYGIRSLADTFLRYWQPGLPVYLRFQVVNVDDADYARLGFMPSVTGDQQGIYDVLIDPPADVKEVSMHNIGIFGGQLQFGARVFLISHTFVVKQMEIRNLSDPYDVWRGENVMGLYYNHRLFSIESIIHEDVGSETTLWSIVGNSMETASPAK